MFHTIATGYTSNVKMRPEVSQVGKRDKLTDARIESDGEVAESAKKIIFEAVSGSLVSACAKANASPTNNEGDEIEEIYRAGAT